MKRLSFIILFVSVNLFFIFFQIHKNSQMVQLSYDKQRYEKQLADLTVQKKEHHNQLCALQDRGTIKTFAQKKLHMEPVKLNQITTLASNE